MLIFRKDIFWKLNHAPDSLNVCQLTILAQFLTALAESRNFKVTGIYSQGLNDFFDFHQIQNRIGHSDFQLAIDSFLK